jgi:hypothetical protein
LFVSSVAPRVCVHVYVCTCVRAYVCVCVCVCTCVCVHNVCVCRAAEQRQVGSAGAYLVQGKNGQQYSISAVEFKATCKLHAAGASVLCCVVVVSCVCVLVDSGFGCRNLIAVY